ncbi:hypothetical protein J3E69DRAFT_348931 [Trichoderma sp. SZMC 28015]
MRSVIVLSCLCLLVLEIVSIWPLTACSFYLVQTLPLPACRTQGGHHGLYVRINKSCQQQPGTPAHQQSPCITFGSSHALFVFSDLRIH